MDDTSEEETILGFGEANQPPSQEVVAAKRRSSDDRDRLLDKLDNLVSRLTELDPPFKSWVSVMDELELSVDLLEKHEENERASISALLRQNPDRAAKRLPVANEDSPRE